jgi:hypothetical protein
VKQKVLAIRARMPRIGTRKLYYLLEEEFKCDGIKMGRDSLFRLLREAHLLIQKEKEIYHYNELKTLYVQAS